MRHRDHNVQGTQACQKCEREMAAEKCIEDHEKCCKATKLEWIVCCTVKYAVNWKHKCPHKVLHVQRITDRLKNTDVSFARKIV